MNPASSFLRSLAGLVAAVIVFTAGQARAVGPVLSDENLFAALNLDHSGLAAVKADVDAGNLVAAKTSLATYLRQRTNVTWWWNPHAVTTNIGYNKASADQFVSGYVFYSGIGHTFPGGDIDWFYNITKDPGNSYPDNNEWQWQLNRFDEWRNLGNTYWGTGNESYAAAWVSQLRDWLTSCPAPATEQNVTPSAWRTIECGIRMTGSWNDAYHRFLRSPSFTDQDVCDYLKSCIEHGRYLLAYPSSGNWLMIEMSGLYTVGALFPELKEASNWRATAANTLAVEQGNQFYPDGAHKELSPVYHRAALSSALSIYNMAKLQGYLGELPANYMAGLEKSHEHYLRFMAPDRTLPQFNDANHRVDSKPGLSDGFNLFPNRNDFLWVTSDGASGTPPSFVSTSYPWAGFNVMRSGWGNTDNYLCFDVGPVGSGHWHQDKLNVVLWAYGQKLLFDSGGGEYESSIWRTYGTSTWSHNTVIVNGNNQVGGDGDNTYVDPDHVTQSAQTWRWESDVAHDFAAGTYNRGYSNYYLRPATHARRVLFVKPDLYLVADTLVASAFSSPTYQARWHLLPATREMDPVTKVITTTQAGQPNLAVVPCLQSGISVSSEVGKTSDSASGLLGWDVVTGSTGHYPATTVTHTQSGSGTKHFLTLLMPLRTGETNPVTAVVNTGPTSARVELVDGRKLLVSADPNSARGLKLTELLADNSTNRVAGGGFTPPTISAIASQVTAVNTPVGPVPFTVGSTSHAATSLVVSARSLNTEKVLSSGIAFGGTGANRTVTVTPAPNSNGTATTIVTVMDPDGDTTSTQFTVNIGNVAYAEDYFRGNTSNTSPMGTALKWEWNHNGSLLWNKGPGSGDVAHFGNWHGFQPSDGGQTYAWGGIRFAAPNWTMNTAAGGIIALKGVANDWIIKSDFTGGGNNVIHSPLALNMDNGFIDMVGRDSTLTLNGVIKNGTGTGLGIRGNGKVVFTGANTYSGTTTLGGGTLRATTNAGALGAGALAISGGILDLANDTGLSFGRNTTVTGDATIISQRLAAGAGVTHTLGTLAIGAQTLTVQGGNVTSGTAQLAFGATTLTGAATFAVNNPTGGGLTRLSLGAMNNGGHPAIGLRQHRYHRRTAHRRLTAGHRFLGAQRPPDGRAHH